MGKVEKMADKFEAREEKIGVDEEDEADADAIGVRSDVEEM